MTEESESDKERLLIDNSSENSDSTPLKALEKRDEQSVDKTILKRPSTPPRRLSSANMDIQDSQTSPKSSRRLSFPVRKIFVIVEAVPNCYASTQLRQPRIMNLLAESRPEENEVKSEAAFQRLISSSTGLPIQPRTPRVAADRGRYPEEAGQEEEPQREDSPSDDEDESEDTPFAFSASGGSQPITIQKPRTPAGSLNGDDLYMSISESSSFGTVAMDVDLVSSIFVMHRLNIDVPQPPGSPATMSTHWRYTPPPTTSAVRSNKRKRTC
jgi:hypothetical protein